MKRPKTIDGLIAAVERAAHANGAYIRKVRRCNAGWGLMYGGPFVPLSPPTVREQELVVWAYYPTIGAMARAEYRRIVERKPEKGGSPW